jgi:hypothetical protein
MTEDEQTKEAEDEEELFTLLNKEEKNRLAQAEKQATPGKRK